MRPLLLLPEMILFVGGLAALITGSFLPRQRQRLAGIIGIVALVASTTAAAVGIGDEPTTAFDGTYAIDTATAVARVVIGVATLLVVILATEELRGSSRESETYALLLFAAAGAQLLAGANDLLVLAVAFLLASIPLYGLIGLARTPNAAEAAMKTYLLGALFGITLLLGVTLLYALAGSTAYGDISGGLRQGPRGVATVAVVAVIGGLMFKAGGVPAHFWVPDAAQGANVTAATFLTTVPKLGALVALYRLVTTLGDTVASAPLLATLAVLSMTLGNFAAYWQTDPRRLLGYSTVSQLGYLLVPVVVAGRNELALPSLLFYLAAYAVTNVAAFAVAGSLPGCRDLGAYRGLARREPLLAAALVVALLGLVGTPPMAVFVGKLTTVTAAWDGGYAWLSLVVLANSVVSLFYYLRWIISAYRRDGQSLPALREDRSARRSAKLVGVTAAAVSVVLGAGGGLAWSLLAQAALA